MGVDDRVYGVWIGPSMAAVRLNVVEHMALLMSEGLRLSDVMSHMRRERMDFRIVELREAKLLADNGLEWPDGHPARG